MSIEFVNHYDNFVLRNGKLVSGLLAKDGVHLTNAGTSVLLSNFNDVKPITESSATLQQRHNQPEIYYAANRLSTMKKNPKNYNGFNQVENTYMYNESRTNFRGNESSGRTSRNYDIRPENRRPCYNCGEANHSVNYCRYQQRLQITVTVAVV